MKNIGNILGNKTGLTDAKLKGLKAPERGQIEVSDPAVPGLRVRIGATGLKTFIVRKRVGGRIKNMTIGQYGARFGLADARKKARSIISDIETGGDPSSKLRTPSKRTSTLTIRSMVPDYLAAKADRRSVGEMKRVLENYVIPVLGDRMADAVTRGDITALVDSVAATAPVMARNVHAQLSAFYSWALPRLDRLPTNPCRDAGRPKAPKARDRVLDDRELVTLWKLLEAEPLPWGPALKLLILTGQRRDEVFSADRSEFDLKRGEWWIPAERAKNGERHFVPLSREALAVLKKIDEVPDSPKLFPAKGQPQNGPSGFSKVQARLRAAMLEKLGVVRDWTLHDIRRTAATGLQRLGVRLEVTEAVLNHVSGSRSGIVGVYQRYGFAAEKRAALEVWGAEVQKLVTEQPTKRAARASRRKKNAGAETEQIGFI